MEQQPEYQETSKEMRLAMALFCLAAAADIGKALYNLPNMAAWDWLILYRGVAIGVVVGSIGYAAALIFLAAMPGIVAVLYPEQTEGPAAQKRTERPLPTGQPKRERPYIEALPLVEQPTFEAAPGQTIEADPDWQLRVDAMDYGNGRLYINGHLVESPKGFDIEWLYAVARARHEGKLTAVSLRALDEIGISRWGNGGSPASLTISVLEETDCIEGRGANQPYTWTDGGGRAFPSPTDK